MGNRRWKFSIGIAIIVIVALYEAVSGFQQSKSYYVTVSQLLNGKVTHQHIRVGGVVEQGSITRKGDTLSFRLAQNSLSIPVVYVGTETLPDTFKDGAQAVVQGSYQTGGIFRAEHVQAKCASKYVAAPPGPKGGNMARVSGLGSPAAGSMP
ncbi:MAG: cytochrome c maturation protein CcmE [Acidobacteriota bacterium]|nr:cytochrome c maturation protein CcmE [Acidobacteriota bacterium]